MLKNREEVLQNDKQTGLTDSKLRLMVSFKINSMVFLLLNVIYLFFYYSNWYYEYGLLRGRPFDPEGGGGGLANLVGTDYLFSSRAWPENLFPGKPRTEYLFSTATNF